MDMYVHGIRRISKLTSSHLWKVQIYVIIMLAAESTCCWCHHQQSLYQTVFNSLTYSVAGKQFNHSLMVLVHYLVEYKQCICHSVQH